MEADFLGRVLGRKPYAAHHLGTGDEGREDVISAGMDLLTHGEQSWDQRGTVMHAHARLAQVIQFKRMAEHSVGERGERRNHFDVGAQDRSGAARSIELRIVNDHAAPWQAGAEDADTHGVDDRLFRLLHDVRRYRLERQAMAEGSEFARRRYFLVHAGTNSVVRSRTSRSSMVMMNCSISRARAGGRTAADAAEKFRTQCLLGHRVTRASRAVQHFAVKRLAISSA